MPKNCRVIYDFNAEKDFREIAKYLVENDFDTSIIDKIRKKIDEHLMSQPLSDKREDGIYKTLIMKKNMVYYEINGAVVRVLQIRAGGMDSRYGE